MSRQNNSAWTRLIQLGKIAVCAMSLLVLSVPVSRATVLQNEITNPQDPWGHYGQCGDPSTSATGRKAHAVFDVKADSRAHLDQITAIKVLDCHGNGGGGGTHFVTCPPGWPAAPAAPGTAYCLENANDGGGNYILEGVRLNPKLPCYKANVRRGPPDQIDVVLQSPLLGISGFTASSATNARWQFYSVGGAYGRTIITFTKINPGQPAKTGPIQVALGEGTPQRETCRFGF